MFRIFIFIGFFLCTISVHAYNLKIVVSQRATSTNITSQETLNDVGLWCTSTAPKNAHYEIWEIIARVDYDKGTKFSTLNLPVTIKQADLPIEKVYYTLDEFGVYEKTENTPELRLTVGNFQSYSVSRIRFAFLAQNDRPISLTVGENSVELPTAISDKLSIETTEIKPTIAESHLVDNPDYEIKFSMNRYAVTNFPSGFILGQTKARVIKMNCSLTTNIEPEGSDTIYIYSTYFGLLDKNNFLHIPQGVYNRDNKFVPGRTMKMIDLKNKNQTQQITWDLVFSETTDLSEAKLIFIPDLLPKN
jgi:hypothetical protein